MAPLGGLGSPQVDALLRRFEARAVPAADCPWSHRFDGAKHPGRAVFGCLVHGDEVGTLPAVLRIMERLSAGDLPFGGRADFFVGNPPAARASKRCLESDLNRVFVPGPPGTWEHRRALELMPLLSDCQLFLDLHQTRLRTERPFFTLPWRPLEDAWVRWLAPAVPDVAWITRSPEQDFSPSTRCADEFVRDGGGAGITLELGQRGFSEAVAASAERAIERALTLMDLLAEGADLQAQAEAHQRPPLFRYVFAQDPGSEAARLRPGLSNFAPVRAGDPLHAPGSPPLIAPADGVLIFPKYPAPGEPLPEKIYRIAAPLESPADL
jgi:succinylglutamate desuccinylase